MSEHELKLVLEALFMVHKSPLSLEKIQSIIQEEGKPGKDLCLKAIELLKLDYQSRAIELVKVANGYRLQTKSKYKYWIEQLLTEKTGKYSRAVLETLAIIAYKQPVTRGDIEDIRGVGVSSSIIKTLIEREWIKVSGYKDVPGKPAVYSTTKNFLDYFNLQKLDDLPWMDEMNIEKEEQLV